MQAARGATITGGATAERATGPRRRLVTLVGAIAVVGTLVDQAVKAWAVATLPPGEPQPFVGRLLQLTLVRNSGAAFSLGAGTTWVFPLLAVVALVALVVWILPRLGSLPWAVAAGLFGAGIAGNLVDRLVRPPAPLQGHVVDFLQLAGWPGIFNVADVCIVSAAVLVVWLSFFGRTGLDGRPNGGKARG